MIKFEDIYCKSKITSDARNKIWKQNVISVGWNILKHKLCTMWSAEKEDFVAFKGNEKAWGKELTYFSYK